MKIEALFGGALALFVLAVVAFVIITTSFGPRPPDSGSVVVIGAPGEVITVSAEDLVCQCFNQGFDLAGSSVGVMSSQYRTGFEQCRALGKVEAGEAWTAGWNARLSAKPYQSSCRAWRRTQGI